ncbi:unnamed protein product, partial [Larinioides sclopetarius]
MEGAPLACFLLFKIITIIKTGYFSSYHIAYYVKRLLQSIFYLRLLMLPLIYY